MKKISATVLAIVLVLSVICGCEKKSEQTETPKDNSVISIYVSVDGDDDNEGTERSPFKSIQRAVEEVRNVDIRTGKTAIEVIFSAGEYSVSGVELTKADSGSKDCPVIYKAKSGEKVVFNGGITIDPSKFEKVSPLVQDRLTEDAFENVYFCNLLSLGIKRSDLGPTYKLGNFTTAKNDIELFWNEERMTVARYPNSGFLKFEDVIDLGGGGIGGIVTIDEDTASRVAKWDSYEMAWMYGYFGVDWSFTSSKIDYFDDETGELGMTDYSHYGLSYGRYYFSNVLEELDAPGEYYIDNEMMNLYIWPESDVSTANIMLSMSEKPIITATETSYVTFDGITFTGTRGEAILFENTKNMTVRNCVVNDVGGWAVYVSGSDNLVENCEIYNIGKGGISFTGGDATNLVPGNNVAYNNYIHDWAQVKLTYMSGIELCGCGNRASHNELARTTHMAIYYYGPEQIIEYNYIHETVQQSNDAGAIYGGRQWTAYGCVIRYNLIENTGNENYHPVAIYWDDTLSGQTAYGNIIKNCGAKGFLIGGGRDNKVYNNIILNCDEYAIMYDHRGYYGVRYESWGPNGNNSYFWKELKSVNVKEGIWLEKYPSLSQLNIESYNYADPKCPANPINSIVKNNLIVYNNTDETMVYRNGYGFLIDETVLKYSTFENNPVYTSEKDCLIDGTYELTEGVNKLLPEFERIPVEEIGRIKE